MGHRKPGTLRIIGGQWRSRQFLIAPGDTVRPTPDRVRQTLFDWLAPRIEGARCLDLFAGSGALGLEALSRGAASSCFVDTGAAQISAIRDAARKLQAEASIELVQADVRAFLNGAPRSFNVVFADPPYQSGQLPEVLRLLVPWLAADHRVYVEWEGQAPVLGPGWEWLREKRAGRVSFGLLCHRTGEP